MRKRPKAPENLNNSDHRDEKEVRTRLSKHLKKGRRERKKNEHRKKGKIASIPTILRKMSDRSKGEFGGVGSFEKLFVNLRFCGWDYWWGEVFLSFGERVG